MTIIRVHSDPRIRRDRYGKKFTETTLVLQCQALVLTGQELTRGALAEHLSPRQCAILQALMLRHSSGLVSLPEMIEWFWPNSNSEPEWTENVIRVHLCGLRKKLDALGCSTFCQWGFGWKLIIGALPQ